MILHESVMNGEVERCDAGCHISMSKADQSKQIFKALTIEHWGVHESSLYFDLLHISRFTNTALHSIIKIQANQRLV